MVDGLSDQATMEEVLSYMQELARRGPSPAQRAARRMMEMIGALHARGFEGLRLHAGLAPSGCYWRGGVYPVRDPDASTGTFSTGAGTRVLFDWDDSDALDVSQLADRFLAAFPMLAALARHSDPAYAAWYREMLALTAPDGVIYFSADFPLPPSGVGVSGSPEVGGVSVPRPPS
jgi:hypothetical protein